MQERCMAMLMGLHTRLGRQSPLYRLDDNSLSMVALAHVLGLVPLLLNVLRLCWCRLRSLPLLETLRRLAAPAASGWCAQHGFLHAHSRLAALPRPATSLLLLRAAFHEPVGSCGPPPCCACAPRLQRSLKV